MKPCWNPETHPFAFKRTSTNYIRVPIADLEKRMRFPEWLKDMAQKIDTCGKAWIAGGFLSNLFDEKSPADIDIFFGDDDSFYNVIELIENGDFGEYEISGGDENGDKIENLAENEAVRYIDFIYIGQEDRPKIQLIKTRIYETPEEVIDSFDFTVTQFALCGQSIVCNPVSLMDMPRKRIVPHQITFPSSSLRRMIKYTKKGFFACPGALEELATQVGLAMVDNPSSKEVHYID